jgi:thymidine kinase
VILAALDGDFKRAPFGRVLELIPLAEKASRKHLIWLFS